MEVKFVCPILVIPPFSFIYRDRIEAQKCPDLQIHTCRFSVNDISPPHGASLIAALYYCRQCPGLADATSLLPCLSA